eukprot:gene20691-1111_t
MSNGLGANHEEPIDPVPRLGEVGIVSHYFARVTQIDLDQKEPKSEELTGLRLLEKPEILYSAHGALRLHVVGGAAVSYSFSNTIPLNNNDDQLPIPVTPRTLAQMDRLREAQTVQIRELERRNSTLEDEVQKLERTLRQT